MRSSENCIWTVFSGKLGRSREGTDWEKVLRVLVIYRLLSPGAEWRLHRQWFGTTALPDLLGVDERAAQPTTLYRCLDLMRAEKEALFAHLRERWRELFAARYEVLLYDLTSTYFECDVPEAETDPRRFGSSRDRRSDCVQVVIALVVTPKARLNRMEAALTERPWVEVQGQLRVKCVPQDGELYVLTESPARVDKERAMRLRTLKNYWKRLGELSRVKTPTRDELLLKLGQAAGEAGAVARLIDIVVSAEGVFTYQRNGDKLRIVRRRDGRYLLRTNLLNKTPPLIRAAPRCRASSA